MEATWEATLATREDWAFAGVSTVVSIPLPVLPAVALEASGIVTPKPESSLLACALLTLEAFTEAFVLEDVAIALTVAVEATVAATPVGVVDATASAGPLGPILGVSCQPDTDSLAPTDVAGVMEE